LIDLIIDQQRKDLGGFEVGRVLPQVRRRMVGPFVFFDHMGPSRFEPGFPRSVDVRPHPHIGLSTLTYLFEGEITHRDSVGAHQAIHPGEVNWMTAGKGVTHSERFETLRAEGGRLHGIQAWIALPTELEEIDPSFDNHKPVDLPTYESPDGLWARAKGELPAEYPERAAYVVEGEVDAAGQRLTAGQMAVFKPGQTVLFTAVSEATVMLLGGEPVGERFIEWNFVSSSKARIEQAKADWRAGRMKLPDADDQDFIPLP
jgi:redox-sensitive bicupin YhaK (pirin superfamily)